MTFDRELAQEVAYRAIVGPRDGRCMGGWLDLALCELAREKARAEAAEAQSTKEQAMKIDNPPNLAAWQYAVDIAASLPHEDVVRIVRIALSDVPHAAHTMEFYRRGEALLKRVDQWLRKVLSDEDLIKATMEHHSPLKWQGKERRDASVCVVMESLAMFAADSEDERDSNLFSAMRGATELLRGDGNNPDAELIKSMKRAGGAK